MTPSQVHMHFDVFVSAGRLPTITVGEPGIHGAAVAGTHGAGEKTPSLAAVAAITTGFVGAEHMPNDAILAIGAKSMIVAAGNPPIITGTPFGTTVSGQGATPNVHISIAPLTTTCPIARTPLSIP